MKFFRKIVLKKENKGKVPPNPKPNFNPNPKFNPITLIGKFDQQGVKIEKKKFTLRWQYPRGQKYF